MGLVKICIGFLISVVDPGFGEYHLIDHIDHLDICKPYNKNSPLYQITLEFIKDCIPFNVVDHILKANMPDEFVLPGMMS